MKYRILTKTIQKALKTFPAVVVTGPRQSGKTTLLKGMLTKTHQYINLENPDIRSRAQLDPVAFMSNIKTPVIMDEIQYVPELLAYIKDAIDTNRKPGSWVLTGSQNFSLMANVTESLAGRAAILSLLPFMFSEQVGNGERAIDVEDLLVSKKKKNTHKHSSSVSIAEAILRGSYPEIASKPNVDRELWCGSYITTYLERDIRNLSQVGDLGEFERFLRLCATRTGQILNYSDLARDIGISVPTAKRWISMLETGYQIFLLYPYYKNIGKRLVKSPKLYFNDTALASYLLGLHDAETMRNSPHFGNLFETFVVTDFWKRFLHFGQLPSLYYIKTRDGLEVDLVFELKQKLHLCEIKSSATITPRHVTSLRTACTNLSKYIASAHIISQASENFIVSDSIRNHNWKDLLGA